jgi:hypothetical protein
MAPELAQDMALIQTRMNNMKTSDNRQNNPNNQGFQGFAPRRGNFNRNWRQQSTQSYRPWRGISTRPNSQRLGRQLTCWSCQQLGHISRECPNRQVRFNLNNTNRRGNGTNGFNGKGKQGRWGNF